MTEVFSLSAQWPLPPYQASPSKLDQDLAVPLSFDSVLSIDVNPLKSLESFTFEAALLDADFGFDDTTVPDMFAINDSIDEDGDLGMSCDFGVVNNLDSFPPSPSSCSLDSNHSSTSIASQTDGFFGKFPTGIRSRRACSASRFCSRPSPTEDSEQPPEHHNPSAQMYGLLQSCQNLESPESSSAEVAVTKLCWPILEATTMTLTRQQRVQRYLEKRKRRTFTKTIRYEARRAYAEVRPRIKGRFATKEEAAAMRTARIQEPFAKTEG